MNNTPDQHSDSPNQNSSDSASSEPPGRAVQTGFFKLLVKRTQALAVDGLAVGVISELFTALVCAFFFPDVIKHTQAFITVLAYGFVAGMLGCYTGLLLVFAIALIGLSLSSPSILALSEIPPGLLIATLLTALLVDAAYHVAFEITASATIGKQIAKIQLVDKKGQKLSIWRTALRHNLKGVGLIALMFLPVTWLAFCNRRQMLHDAITGTIIDTNAAVAVRKSNPSVYEHEPARLPNLKGAGIPRRVVASVTDALLYYFADAVSYSCFAYLLARFSPENFGFVPPPFEDAAAFAFYCALTLPAFLLPAIIMAAFESSRLQATPGKIIAGLKVVNLNGERCGFWQALTKQLMQACVYVSLLTVAIVTLFILKERLSAVGLAILFLFYLCYGAIFCWTFDNQQTLFDRLTKRFVLNDFSNNALELTKSGASQ